MVHQFKESQRNIRRNITRSMEQIKGSTTTISLVVYCAELTDTVGSPSIKPRDGVSFSHKHEEDDCLKAVTNDHDFGGELEWVGQLQRTVTCPECGLLLWACVSG